ncbi:MAG: AraC family transcriptional regulator, partial [Spirochaetales bacterium]
YRSVEDGKPWIVNWFTFGGYHIEQLLHTLNFQSSGVFSLSGGELLHSAMEQALHALLSSRSSKGLDCSVMVYSFLMDIYRHAHLSSDESLERKHERLEPVLSLISRDYAKPLTIDDLAAAIGLSPQHFCVVFKQAMNTRPIEYLNLFRIRKSKELMLANDGLKIQEVAKIVGYGNVAYFTTLFKRLEGVSPSEFRRGV